MAEPIEFSLQDLRTFTNNFGDQLPRDLFGTVYYRGRINHGYLPRQPIIVKEFNDSQRTIWEAERHYLKTCQHKNSIKLIGFATDHPNGKYYIVFPYYQNGTLQQRLPDLGWRETIKILKGISSVLMYIHTHFNPYIVHSDIQPENIFLDEKYNAKISNFEAATEGGQQQRNGTRRTTGYIDPSTMEQIKPATDIYSLGIIMLQLITKETCISVQNELRNMRISRHWEATNFVAHESLLRTGCNTKKAEFIINLAIKCIDQNTENRPTAAVVVDMLDDLDAKFPILKWLQRKIKMISR